MHPGAPHISVEVVYAEPLRAVSKTFRIAAPATVADVLRLASERAEFAGVIGVHSSVGIFGRCAEPGEPVDDGDRIEIYRALSADPKADRRSRARQARQNARRLSEASKSGRS